ncbi:hypothetical protein FBQ97_18750, partial [Acidobacteria bacterium ACD]|nr:hypothetical protein [Acidobacteria bacterium ACD]
MRRLVALVALALVSSVGAAEEKDDLLAKGRQLFKPIPAQAPAAKGNPASPAKVELGRMLYFDPRLSSSQLISCNTCHNVSLAGADLQETSTGHGWQKGPRNAPTVLNAVFNVAQFWDGRAEDLKAQAKGPVQASVEMNNDPARVVATLKSLPGYVAAFGEAFPGEADPVTFDNVAKAIEVFEATLLTPDAPFDLWLKGDGKALAPAEKAGLALFVDKGCARCHAGVNVGGEDYDPFGVVEAPPEEVRPAGDVGRFKVTNTSADRYVFRAAPLRNVAVTQTQSVVQSQPAPAGQGAAATPLVQSGAVAMAAGRQQFSGTVDVNFNNAPAGMRVSAGKADHPGVSINTDVGYRSLSYGAP